MHSHAGKGSKSERTVSSMDRVGVARDFARVDNGVETRVAGTGSTFHAPEGICGARKEGRGRSECGETLHVVVSVRI